MLELERIDKRYRRGRLEVVALRGVSLEVCPAEVVAVLGMEGSGRSTLLRVAAGIEQPDAGEVRFRGRPLLLGERAVAGGIAYCQASFRRTEGEAVLDDLIAAQLARGVRPARARERAWEALERVDARMCGQRRLFELEKADASRVGIARALVQRPSLLLIDEPTKGVDLLERDGILELVRSLSREDIAVLMSSNKATGVFGADRVLSLSNGELYGQGSPEMAEVVRLPLSGTG
jgi:ABC-type multidrug transport system ATPase subunit